MELLARYRDLVLPCGILACLAVILVPLPAGAMDVLLAANITVGVVVLLTAIHVSTPLEFSVFPSLLLATTLSRLVLNIGTTRLILTQADSRGMDAAGGVIRSFGEFVAGNQIEVGLIIFAILIVIQFVVITKGATRISEVAARFALDGMPGRQMAIDADVNAGLIDESQAMSRRAEIQEQADFYGAMDGASKFVRGDAVAAVIITVVNIVGGLYVGIIHAGMPLSEAANVFTKLTIGDGLVSQIPALLISLAAGLLVTRTASKSNLPSQFVTQILASSKTLAIAGGFVLLLLLTDLPKIPMLVMGLGCVFIAFTLRRSEHQEEERRKAEAEGEREKADAIKVKQAEDFLVVDPLEVSIGHGLLPLADPAQGGDLMHQIGQLRNHIAGEMGLILPKVRVRDDVQLKLNEFEIRLSGNTVMALEILTDRHLAIDTGSTTGVVDGTPAESIGPNATWIDPVDSQQAAIYGYLVRNPSEVLIDQLRSVAELHGHEFLTREATHQLLERLRETSPTAVAELIPEILRVSEVQMVLQLLVREGVSIRQLDRIVETLGNASQMTKDPYELCSHVRSALSRTITAKLLDNDGKLHCVTLAPELEQRLIEVPLDRETEDLPGNLPEPVEMACEKLSRGVNNLLMAGHPPTVLVSPRIRWRLKQWMMPTTPWLNVVSYDEITRKTTVQSHEIIPLVPPETSATTSPESLAA